MISRGVGRAIAGLALIAAVSACDDNPLAENREDAEYFRLSVSDAVVEVDGTVGVVANVLNQYGAALVVNVTASECDAGVSVEVDTVRSEYEYPERFLITGNSVGESCVVVNGGGVTDTIRVRVVPASISLTGAAEPVGSGSTVPFSVSYMSAAGAQAPGVDFDPEHTSLVVRTSTIGVADDDGMFTARAPGTTWVVAVYEDFGVTRRDSAQVTVVAGEFTGTAPASVASPGATVTFTEGAVPIDEDTNVTFDGYTTFVVDRDLDAGTITVVVPGGVGATSEFVLSNLGPDQVASQGEITVTNPDTDPYEPNDASGVGTSQLGNMANTYLIPNTTATYYVAMGGSDASDVFRVELPAAQDVTVAIDWNRPDRLVVMMGYNAAGVYTYSGCFTTGKPKSCTVSLPAGTSYLAIFDYPWDEDTEEFGVTAKVDITF